VLAVSLPQRSYPNPDKLPQRSYPNPDKIPQDFSMSINDVILSVFPADFLDLLVRHDVGSVPIWQCVGAFYLASLLCLKPKYGSSRIDAIFWGANLGLSAYFLAEVTWIPFLATIIHTRTSYPYLVVISHCISANISYRVRHGDQTDRLRALLFGFFLYGFGGSIVSDVLLGLPVTALAHYRIIPCHILGWYLVWFSPMDWVFKTIRRRDLAIRFLIGAGEAIDAVTTPMGRIARASRELPNKVTAPLAAGLFAGIGGAIVRFLTGDGTYLAVQAGFFKTMGYSLIFWWFAVYQCDSLIGTDFSNNHCSSYTGSDSLRMTIVLFHVVWGLLCDGDWVSGHPFIWLGEKLLYSDNVGTIASTFRFGPTTGKGGKED